MANQIASESATIAAPVTLGARWRAACARMPNLEAAQASAWSWWLLPIFALGVGLPWLVAALTGSLSIPHSDGWAFSRIAADFARTGQIHFLGWGPMTLVGQVVMLGPLGRWLFVQQSAISLLAIVVVYCAYDLLRFELSRGRALFGTATLACWPGLAVLSTAFMTDVPALAGSLACLALAQHALRRDSRRLLGLALLVGFWTVSVRQQTIAAPIAVLGYALATGPRRPRLNSRWVGCAALAFTFAVIVFMVWQSSLPDRQALDTVLSVHVAAASLRSQLPFAYFTAALFVAPALIAGAQPQRWGTAGKVLAGVSVLLGLLTLANHSSLLLGNFFTVYGSHPSAGQPLIFAAPIMRALGVVMILSGALLAGSLAGRLLQVGPILSAFTALTLAILLLTAVDGHLIYDRYLLPLAPWLLVIALKSPTSSPADAHEPEPEAVRSASPERARWQLATLALAALAAISTALYLNAFSVDGAHWRLAQQLVAGGVPASRVEAGIWDGWVSPHGVARGGASGVLSYGRLEPGMPCVVVENAPLREVGFSSAWQALGVPGNQNSLRRWTLHSVYPYRTFAAFGTSRIYAYDTHARGC